MTPDIPPYGFRTDPTFFRQTKIEQTHKAQDEVPSSHPFKVFPIKKPTGWKVYIEPESRMSRITTAIVDQTIDEIESLFDFPSIGQYVYLEIPQGVDFQLDGNPLIIAGDAWDNHPNITKVVASGTGFNYVEKTRIKIAEVVAITDPRAGTIVSLTPSDKRKIVQLWFHHMLLSAVAINGYPAWCPEPWGQPPANP